MTIEEIGFLLVKKADYIGCVHCTQLGEMPSVDDVISDLKDKFWNSIRSIPKIDTIN